MHGGTAQPMLFLEAIKGINKVVNIHEYLVQQSFFIFVQHSGKSLSE
jgi:hypothetical protein